MLHFSTTIVKIEANKMNSNTLNIQYIYLVEWTTRVNDLKLYHQIMSSGKQKKLQFSNFIPELILQIKMYA